MNLSNTICVVIAIATAPNAFATLSHFQNKADWQHAVGNDYETIDFTGYPPNTLITNQYAAQGVLFTDGIDLIFYNNNSFPNDGVGLNGVNSITVEFQSPMRWLAVDHPGSIQFELYLNGQLVALSNIFLHSGNGFFAGIAIDSPFDKARIFSPFGGAFIDDLHFGPAIPAPGALISFTFLGFISRRKRLS